MKFNQNIEYYFYSRMMTALDLRTCLVCILEARVALGLVSSSKLMLVPEAAFLTFNRLDGLARRPISHTCSCTRELSVTYSTFLEFEAAFRNILSSPEYITWIMDAV